MSQISPPLIEWINWFAFLLLTASVNGSPVMVVIPPPAYAQDSLSSVNIPKGSYPLFETEPMLGSLKPGYIHGFSGLKLVVDLYLHKPNWKFSLLKSACPDLIDGSAIAVLPIYSKSTFV